MSFSSYLKAENIYQEVQPFYYLTKIFGLASYRLSKWECCIHTSIVDFSILGVTICIWTVVWITQIVFMVDNPEEKGIFESGFLNKIYAETSIIQHTLSLFLFLFNHFK